METLIQLIADSFARHGIETVPDRSEHPVERLIQLVSESFARHGLEPISGGSEEAIAEADHLEHAHKDPNHEFLHRTNES